MNGVLPADYDKSALRLARDKMWHITGSLTRDRECDIIIMDDSFGCVLKADVYPLRNVRTRRASQLALEGQLNTSPIIIGHRKLIESMLDLFRGIGGRVRGQGPASPSGRNVRPRTTGR